MNSPVLVILAAGMGSRFGGLKQITPVDDRGHAIIDYSLYDAYQAGFRDVVFVIKHAIDEDFRRLVGSRAERHFSVRYFYQELDCLPEGYSVPEGRTKPWGTGHAVLCAGDVIDGPFAVLNADDFYGRGAYEALYGFLSGPRDDNEHAMVAYRVINTVTDNGSVARGICTGSDGFLTDVVERVHVERYGNDARYTEDGGEHYTVIDGQTLVSMNCWGFSPSVLQELNRRFPPWLDENLPVNPLKCEYFLPTVVNNCIQDGSAVVRLLNCEEKWYGMTYQEDIDSVRDALANLVSDGVYTPQLLDDEGGLK